MSLIVAGAIGLPTTPAIAAGAAGGFVPLTSRVFDSRQTSPLTANSPKSLQISGKAGVPTSGVTAVALTLTALNYSSAGYLRAAPSGKSLPNVSMVNYDPRNDRPTSNTALIELGSDGSIQVQASTDTDVLVDIQGYYLSTSSSSATQSFVPVTPEKVADTKTGIGTARQRFAAGANPTIQVAGRGGVPSGVTGAVFANVVVTSYSADDHAWVEPYASGTNTPGTSINVLANSVTAVGAVLDLGTDGAVTLLVGSSSIQPIDVEIDIEGYFSTAPTPQTAGAFTPSTIRLYDSRTTNRLGANSSKTLQVSGNNGVPSSTSTVSTVAINVKVSGGDETTVGYLSFHPVEAPDSKLNALDFGGSDWQSNLTLVKLGASGQISVENHSATSVAVIIDTEGWYSTKSGNSQPATPTGVTIYPDKYSYTDGNFAGTASNSPAFVATISDPNGDPGVLTTEIYGSQNPDPANVVSTCTSSVTSNGSAATCEITEELPDNTTLYARSKTSDLYGADSGYTSWLTFTTPPADSDAEDPEDATADSGYTPDATPSARGIRPAAVDSQGNAADVVWSTSATAPSASFSTADYAATYNSQATADSATAAAPPAYSIPDAGWKFCGLFDGENKLVKRYYRRGTTNPYQSMKGTRGDLNCGNDKFGYLHELVGKAGGGPDDPTSHAGQWQGLAYPIQRNWRDLAGWATSWTLYQPEVVRWRSDSRTFCESREVYLYQKTKEGWKLVDTTFASVGLGTTGVRIITMYPNGAAQCTKGIRIR